MSFCSHCASVLSPWACLLTFQLTHLSLGTSGYLSLGTFQTLSYTRFATLLGELLKALQVVLHRSMLLSFDEKHTFFCECKSFLENPG